jgi:hypothetical protein
MPSCAHEVVKGLSHESARTDPATQLSSYDLRACCEGMQKPTAPSNCNEHRVGTNERVLWWWRSHGLESRSRLRTGVPIATMLPSEPINCDDGRTNNHRTRLQGGLRPSKFECNESCNEPWHVRPRWRSRRTIKTSNARANKVQQSQARKLAWSNQSIDEINQHDVRESGQSRGSLVMRIARKYKKAHNNQLDCDCCLVSFPCGQVHRYLHSQTTQKGSSSLNKLDNKPDWFFTTQHA